MQVRVVEKSLWNKLLTKELFASFTQSAEWASILESEGKTVDLLEVLDGEQVIAQALICYMPLPFGWRYAFSPCGPVIKEQSEVVYETIVDFIKNKQCLFWRIEPAQALLVKGAVTKVYDVNPRATTVLDLVKTEEELLAAMHTKARYNIRLAEKKGVRIVEGKNWDAFWKLMSATGERDGFRLHDKKHYEAIFASPFITQLSAEVEGKVAATAIFVGYGALYTYLFGASDYNLRQYMAPQLLQWEGVRLAKRLGYLRYDFFGIAPGEYKEGEYLYDEKHQYAGVTRFKLGFGGHVEQRPGTFDLLISPMKYRVYAILRTIRRLI